MKRIILWVLVAIIAIAHYCWVLPALATTLPTEGIRTTSQEFPLVRLPNWDSISLSDLGGIEMGGAIPDTFNEQIGYDISRTWQAGEFPDRVLKLGDIEEGLSPQEFFIGEIAQKSGFNLEDVALSAFKLVGEQTLSQLTEAVPLLENFAVGDVPPIADVLGTPTFNGQTIGEVLQQQPELGNLPLSNANLEQYAASDIPNLHATQLGDLNNWRSSVVADTPGMGQVPLGNFPTPLGPVGSTVARIDFLLGPMESARDRTISGSQQEGFAVPCTPENEFCAHAELDDLENQGRSQRGPFEGKAWITGKGQEVEGGFGVLGQLFGGKEPTGRHPFGDAFKVALWEVNEAEDTVSSKLFFRFCQRGTPDLGCTPYAIGPVPFLTFERDQVIFIGKLDGSEQPNNSQLSQEEVAKIHNEKKRKLLERQGFFDEQAASSSSTSSSSSGSGGSSSGSNSGSSDRSGTSSNSSSSGTSSSGNNNRACTGNSYQGFSIDGLADAIAHIESAGSGGYDAIGVQTCDGAGNCGIALGRYQFMSYHPAAVEQIEARGGGAWLDSLNAGATPTVAELNQYFPPEAQDAAFEAEAQYLLDYQTERIDPQTGTTPVGDRRVELLAQMWFGGPGVTYDGGGSDVHGGYSIYDYGVTARQYYNNHGGGEDCNSPTEPIDPGGSDGEIQGAAPEAANLATGTYVHPAPGSVVTSGYGMRTHPITGGQQHHAGLDFGAATGSAINAIDGGVVSRIVTGCQRGDRSCGGGYGNYIEVDHGGGRFSFYSHLQPGSISVSEGDSVSQGQTIAGMGSTGMSTGPHLHFELDLDGQGSRNDPTPHLPI